MPRVVPWDEDPTTLMRGAVIAATLAVGAGIIGIGRHPWYGVAAGLLGVAALLMGGRAWHLQRHRRLDRVQRAQLRRHLAGLPAIDVRIYAPQDAEAIAYAGEFLAVFREAGWPVKGVYRSAEAAAGVYLGVHPTPTGRPNEAGYIRTVLGRAGIHVVEYTSYEQRPQATVDLLIGQRPR
jgi:hypothetical protein